MTLKIESAKQKALQEHIIDGVQYDYVWPIQFDSPGMGDVRLGYNIGENPWEVAEAFLHKYQLPIDNKEAIVQHILRNTQGSRLDGSQASPSSEHPVQHDYKQNTFQSKLFPKLSIVLFDTNVNFEGILKKLKEFNSEYLSDPTSSFKALLDEELEKIVGVMEKLAQKPKWHTISWNNKEFAVMWKLLTWDGNKLFPVLDLLRCWSLHYDAAIQFLKFDGPMSLNSFFNGQVPRPVADKLSGDLVNDVCLWGIDTVGHPVNKKLSAWFLCNLFACGKGMLSYEEEVLKVVNKLRSGSKTEEVAALSIILNLSTLWHSSPTLLPIYQVLKEWLSVSLTAPAKDPHILVVQSRLLLCLGNMVSTSQAQQVKAKNSDLMPSLQQLIESDDPFVRECSKDLVTLFKQKVY
eukprot:TRINITY_DN2348_c0_g1_i13.p1 TRINITY_DN2348_c0_g1~~TRINITY_DN2348_c0_g1_i13.p1  ORF type:complete len:406 (+),score=78.84 TRINITY_DN2348_c0_g1_i13:1183-2400(+)